MLSTLVSHNPDIAKLVDKGYAISTDNNYLVVRDVPYLDQDKLLKNGTIVTKLVDIGDQRFQIDDHQIFFCGSHPHELDGKPIGNLGGGVATLALASTDLVVERSFSNKPTGGFSDFFEKIESYVTIISGPAMSLYEITPLTFRTSEDISTSVFKIRDTLTSRAEIGDLAQKFADEIVAIIGLGGTGSYILDFLAKTPVKEIRGFDLDWYYAHNAFRSPGRLDVAELGKKKVEVYRNRYDSFRSNINLHPKQIFSDCMEDMQGVTFCFVCVDKGSSRKEICQLLTSLQIPFIDVGMGLDRPNGLISGTLRTTYIEPNSPLLQKNHIPMTDLPDDIYRNNIQISELNALNACLAVIKYKQLKGFYADDGSFHHMLFTLDNLQLVKE